MTWYVWIDDCFVLIMCVEFRLGSMVVFVAGFVDIPVATLESVFDFRIICSAFIPCPGSVVGSGAGCVAGSDWNFRSGLCSTGFCTTPDSVPGSGFTSNSVIG